MFFLLLFSRIIQEQIPSSIPTPPPLTAQAESCGTGYVTFKENTKPFILYPQYQVNDSDWQDDTLFSNLIPDTLYKFTARYRSYPPSDESEEYKFDCTDYDGPVAPVRSMKNKQTKSYIDIDPLIVEIVEKNDNSIQLKAIQTITVNISLEYHKKDGEWQSGTTFRGLGSSQPYYFTSRYQSIETPDNGPPTYIRTLKSKNINCNQEHTCRYSHISLSSFMFISIIYQK